MLSFLIARRFLSGRRGGLSGFIIRLAIGATALGVALMVVATAFISGFQHAIRDKLFSFWGQIQIAPFNNSSIKILSSDPVQEDSTLVRQVTAMEGVRRVDAFAMRPGILQARNGDMEGIQLKGVGPGFRLSSSIPRSGGEISFRDSSYSTDILLSETSAARLQVGIGDTVRLYFLAPGQEAPRVRRLRVAGLYHTGMEDVDRRFAICDLRLIHRLADWLPGDINGYQVELEDPARADEVADRIHHQLLLPPMYAYSTGQTYEDVYGWLDMMNMNGRVLLIIVSLVAVISTVAMLLILMVDRTVSIGVLQALGLPFESLRNVFLYLAALIGGWGVLLGNVLGLGLCLAQLKWGFIHLPEDTYYMRTVPVKINGWYLLLIDGGTLLLCVLGTLLPALYLRRVKPARVLQFK